MIFFIVFCLQMFPLLLFEYSEREWSFPEIARQFNLFLAAKRHWQA